MNKKFQKIWRLALPYLKKGKRKNFVIHTEEVVKAMELILAKEKGDKNILIPAAILHDVGWSKVPIRLQRSSNKNQQKKALQLHLEYAPKIINKILVKLKYSPSQIKTIIEIVMAHKFSSPHRQDKRLLIDADNLSEVFKVSFANDLKAYQQTPQGLYNFRMKNKFYTKTAAKIFKQELAKRKEEIYKVN